MARKAKRSTSRSKKPAKRRAPARKAAARKAAARKAPAKKAAKRRSGAGSGAPAQSAVTPYLVVRGAAAAIEFYKKALGATEMYRMPMPDGSRVMHAELRIGGAPVFLADEFPEMEKGTKAPSALGATTASFHLHVSKNIDTVFDRAVAAGMTVLMPLADAFWGDRFGKLQDPFGHQWSMGMPVRKLTPEQIAEAAKAAFADQS
jgi:PhnB protein